MSQNYIADLQLGNFKGKKMTLASNLIYYRQLNKMSQQELSEALNKDEEIIINWESAKLTPNIEDIIALCRIYKITTDVMLEPLLNRTKANNNLFSVLSSVFLWIMWISGAVVLIMNFFSNKIYEPKLNIFALLIMLISIIFFIVLQIKDSKKIS